MKEINYKQLRKFSNLPKYDPGMTPISSGYQDGDNYVQAGYTTQTATPITNAYMPEALSKAAGTITGLATGLGKTAYNAASSIGKTTVTPGTATAPTVTLTGTTSEGLPIISVQTGEATSATAHTVTPTAAKSAFFKAGGKVLGAAAALHGAIDSVQTADTAGRAPMSGQDLLNSPSRNTEYINGVAYDTYGGYDSAGVNKLLKDYNKANIINQATSGMEFGAGVGSFFGPLGTGIGSLAGLLGGLGIGLFNSGKAKDKMERVIRDTNRAVAGYNRQSESEAANKGIQNQFYATHGDKGIDKVEEPNALVNNDEVIGTVKNGKVKKAYTVDSNLPDRYDGIPANLGPNDFVIGHKIGPDGVELNEKAQVYERMFNSRDPRLQKLGEEGLLATLKTQKHTPDNNPNPWDIFTADKGKNMKRCDKGSFSGAWIPTMAFGANVLDDWAHRKEINKMPITAFNAYTPNPYLLQAGELMPSTYEIGPQKQTINDESRFAKYAIEQSAYSPGQKMALLSSMWNKRMKAMSDLMGEKHQQENTMRANYAKWLSEVGAQEQQMKSAYMQKYYDQLAQANARKFNALQTIRRDKRQNWNDFAQNLWNIYYGNKNIDLYAQSLSNEQKKLLGGK